MGRGPALALVVCAALSGAAISSMPRGASMGMLAVGACLGLAVGLWAARGQGPLLRESRVDRVAIWVPAVFLVPMVTMPVAPGADMAMHAALGRALVDGSDALSPAWGPVTVALYPKGLSALIALASPALGMAKASLFAAGLAYWVVVLGLAAWLQASLRMPHPVSLAALAVLASKAPQNFFDWGGNPTALALGLALFAVALLARAWKGESEPIAGAAGASLLLLGAAATHPTGALVGLSAAVVLPALGRPTRSGLLACLAGIGLLGVGMAGLWLRGPVVSAAEAMWIANYQRDVEAVLSWPRAFFAVDVWRAMPSRLGAEWVVASAASAVLLLVAGQWRRVAWSAVAILAIGALFAFGPLLPGVGLLLYPVRFGPLLLVATAPVVGWALEVLARRTQVASALAAVALAALGVAVHLGAYQEATPMATWNDRAAMGCVETLVPVGAVVEGAYGDATQWIPALTGRIVTHAHPHISLDDEIQAAPLAAPTFAFVGERLRYGSAAHLEAPVGEEVCRSGGASLRTLPSVTAR